MVDYKINFTSFSIHVFHYSLVSSHNIENVHMQILSNLHIFFLNYVPPDFYFSGHENLFSSYLFLNLF